MISRINNYTIKVFILFTFILFLVFQNIIALIIVNFVNLLYVKIIFSFKELICFLSFILMLATVRKYTCSLCDLWGLLLLIYIFMRFGFADGELFAKLYSFRLYAIPVLLYFLGKMYFRNIGYNLERIFIVASFLYTVISLALFSLSKDLFLSWNIHLLFAAKGMDARGASFFEGFPVNYFSFYFDKVFSRLFGAFFDPLASAFFAVPFFFYYFIEFRKKSTFFNIMPLVLLSMVLILTQTRAIIGSILLIIIFINGFKNCNIEVRVKKFFVVFSIFIFIFLSLFKLLIPYADPSSRGHLMAYKDFFDNLNSLPIGVVVFGQGVPDGLKFGSESMYFSIISHGGLVLFMLFILFLFRGLFEIFKNSSFDHKKLTIYSFVCYFVSSFTTEHWFALSSSGFFWILFGLANYKKNDEEVLVYENWDYLHAFRKASWC